MEIRKATVFDIPALVALNQPVQTMHATAYPETFRPNVPQESVERAFDAMIQHPASYWLIAEADRPIGFLSSEFRDREASWCLAAQRICYLAGIAVDPDFRRRGVARGLIAELQREVAARGANRIELDVWTVNEDARQAFTRLGFRSVFERLSLGGIP